MRLQMGVSQKIKLCLKRPGFPFRCPLNLHVCKSSLGKTKNIVPVVRTPLQNQRKTKHNTFLNAKMDINTHPNLGPVLVPNRRPQAPQGPTSAARQRALRDLGAAGQRAGHLRAVFEGAESGGVGNPVGGGGLLLENPKMVGVLVSL